MALPLPYGFKAGDIAEVRFIARLQGQRIMTVLHYTLDPGQTELANGPAALTTLGLTIAAGAPTSVLSQFRHCQSQDVHYEAVEVQKIEPIRWAKVYIPTTVNGTVAEDSAPSNLSADITRLTYRARQPQSDPHVGQNGTTHVAGIPKSQITGNLLLGEYVSESLNDAGVAISSPVLAGGVTWQPILWHRKGPTNDRFDYIVASDALSPVRTMRRRGLGQGV